MMGKTNGQDGPGEAEGQAQAPEAVTLAVVRLVGPERLQIVLDPHVSDPIAAYWSVVRVAMEGIVQERVRQAGLEAREQPKGPQILRPGMFWPADLKGGGRP